MILGRDRLLEAQDKADELERERVRTELNLYTERRVAYLGKTLLAKTIQRTPQDHGIRRNGVSLEPSKKHQNEFRRQLALGEDFEIDRLVLNASGDVSSGWMNYQLNYRYDQNDVKPYQVTSFHADTHKHVRGQESDTHLFLEDQPVQFESQQYNLIRNISGLFLPEVIRALEAEGL